LGKSISEAAKLCLQIIKRKLTTREIVDSLLKGGIETTAKTSFPSIVHSILMRSVKAGSGIIKVDRSHWGLAEWYPRGLASTNRANGKKRQKPGRKPKAAKQTPSEAPKQLESGTVPERILSVLNKPGVELSAQEVGEKVGIKSNVAALLLGQLTAKKCAEKMANGKYRAIKTAA
jgi:predicted transcriptional regulator of viral defense system